MIRLISFRYSKHFIDEKIEQRPRPPLILDQGSSRSFQDEKKVRLKIFTRKTFGGKPLHHEPKHGSENFVLAQALESSGACGASIEKVFEHFKFLLH